MGEIHEYMSAYPYYDENKWRWSIENPHKDNALFMRYRARKDKNHRNMDKLPFFDSIEKDANQFGMQSCTFTDIFGITWNGTKGCQMVSDDPDYEQHLYYYDEDSDGYLVSDEYTQDSPPTDFIKLRNPRWDMWVDVKGIKTLYYKWVQNNNHLFKDSVFYAEYDDGAKLSFYDVMGLMHGLKRLRPDLYDGVLPEIERHFENLRDNERAEVREFWPGMTAREYFDKWNNAMDYSEKTGGPIPTDGA